MLIRMVSLGLTEARINQFPYQDQSWQTTCPGSRDRVRRAEMAFEPCKPGWCPTLISASILAQVGDWCKVRTVARYCHATDKLQVTAMNPTEYQRYAQSACDDAVLAGSTVSGPADATWAAVSNFQAWNCGGALLVLPDCFSKQASSLGSLLTRSQC
jgi:hypothetical protein